MLLNQIIFLAGIDFKIVELSGYFLFLLFVCGNIFPVTVANSEASGFLDKNTGAELIFS